MYVHAPLFWGAWSGALRDQWKELDPLKLELQMAPGHLCWCWEQNPDPKQEQQLSSVAESSQALSAFPKMEWKVQNKTHQ